MSQLYEYRFDGPHSVAETEDEINALARGCWELVQVLQIAGGIYTVMRRLAAQSSGEVTCT